MLPHMVDGGGRLLADGARRLPRVLLHVGDEAAPVGVAGAAVVTHVGATL